MWRLLLGTMGVKSLVQGKDSTQRPRPDSNRGPFDPKSDAVTDWPLRLPDFEVFQDGFYFVLSKSKFYEFLTDECASDVHWVDKLDTNRQVLWIPRCFECQRHRQYHRSLHLLTMKLTFEKSRHSKNASTRIVHSMYFWDALVGQKIHKLDFKGEVRRKMNFTYCKSRIFRTHSIFVSSALQPFVRMKFSYSRWPMQMLFLAVYLSHAFYFRTEPAVYELYENNMHTKYSGFTVCVRVCGVEGRGKSLSGQFFFVCEKDDREESSTNSLGGHDAAQRRNGISNCFFRVRHLSSDTLFSKSKQQLPSSISTRSSSGSSGAWIPSHFRIQVGSADECVAPGRRQRRETRWTSDGRLSSPETNLKVGLLPLFFMQLLLSHMFLSFMVRTSPLSC